MRRLSAIIMSTVLAAGARAGEGGESNSAAEPRTDEIRDGKGAMDLTVMSFNIRYGTADDGENSWPHRRELVFDVIRRHRPDVVGLQEALRFQIDEILEALPEYGDYGVGRDDGESKGEHASILYLEKRLERTDGDTFWLSDTPKVVGSKSWGNSITRICTWARLRDRKSERSVYVYNVHLDHRSQPSRERSVELMARKILDRKEKDPFVVLGDFNAAEDNRAILYLKGELPRASQDADHDVPPSPKLVDTFHVLHPEEKAGTFNGWRFFSPGAKIDYVLVPRDVKVLEASIVRDRKDGRYPSDHFPVMARLRLPPR